MARHDTVLSEDQIAFYAENGYLVAPGLLNPEEVRRFLRHVDDGAPVGTYNLHGHLRDGEYLALAGQERIVNAVRQLLGGKPRIVQTMLLDKPPIEGKGIALHQDLHYLPNDPATPDTLMACWIALTDTDADNGGLCVVPGSHKEGLRSVHRGQDGEEHDSFEEVCNFRDVTGREWQQTMYRYEIDDLDDKLIERLRVPAGAGVFFTGRTIHGSFRNHSPNRPRRAFATHYVREDTHLLRCDVQETMAV